MKKGDVRQIDIEATKGDMKKSDVKQVDIEAKRGDIKKGDMKQFVCLVLNDASTLVGH